MELSLSCVENCMPIVTREIIAGQVNASTKNVRVSWALALLFSCTSGLVNFLNLSQMSRLRHVSQKKVARPKY